MQGCLILRDLHQQAVDQRTIKEVQQYQRYTKESATGDNLQQETDSLRAMDIWHDDWNI